MGKYEAAKASPAEQSGASALQTLKSVFRPGKRLAAIASAATLLILTIMLIVYINTPPAYVNHPAPTEPPPTNNYSVGLDNGTIPLSDGNPSDNTASEPQPMVRKDGFYTFLLIGTNDNYNTDTIMLASLDLNGDSPAVNIISVPRDSQVDVPWDIKRINSVYGVNGGGEAGANALRDEIEEICGVYPDFYVTINISSFTKIVDLVNGVPFYVPYDMHYTSADEEYSVNLNKGQQTLNSADALSMVRYRGTQKNDWGRTELQRDFLIALMKRIKSSFSIDKIPGMIDIVLKSVKTNMPAKDMLWFYTNAVNEMDLSSDITMYSMPDAGSGKYNSGKYGNQDYVFLDRDSIVELINRTLNPYTSDISAEMLNIIRLES